jgi:tetratricopeptide (TPR) repeat protein
MENTENVENTEVIQEKISNIPSNRRVAFDFRDIFEKNRKLVIYGGGGLLLLIIVVGGYFWYNSGREESAQSAISRALHYYEIDSVNMALKGDGTPQGMGLIDVADEYSGTKTAQVAHYLIGMTRLQQGKYQEAIDNLEYFHLKSSIVYPLALGGLGDAYSQLKDYERAAKYYMRAADASDNEYTTPKFYKKAGLVYEKKLGKPDKALELYKKVKEKYRNLPTGIEMDKYIARAWAENGGKD